MNGYTSSIRMKVDINVTNAFVPYPAALFERFSKLICGKILKLIPYMAGISHSYGSDSDENILNLSRRTGKRCS